VKATCSIAVLSTFVSVVATATAMEQPVTIELNGAPTCAACTLERKPVVRLGDDDGPGMLETENLRVLVDSRGNYLVTPSGGSTIKIFDSNGKFVTSIGKKGSGPGEIQALQKVHLTRGDSIHVYDSGLNRHTVFSPTFKLARSVTWEITPSFIEGVTFNDNAALVNVNVYADAKRAGQPLHLVGANGKVIRSFGRDERTDQQQSAGSLSRVIRAGEGSTAWVAKRHRYEIELWDTRTGNVLRRITRKVSWFPASDGPLPAISTVSPPLPRIASMHVDAAGMKWVQIAVADARWRSAVKENKENPGHITILDPRKFRDTYIEVIDPNRKEVVASMRFDVSPGLFFAPGLAQASGELADGSPQVVVERWSLKRPAGGR
jgi:hypothetical protein